MARWFRMHESVLDDYKVQQRLSDAMFRAWVNLLCLTCRCDGTLPGLADIAFALRLSQKETAKVLDALKAVELVDEIEGTLQPHNWNGRQYKSDVSNERVKRHRQRRRNADGNVTSTVTVTASETETDTETEQTQKVSKSARAPRIPKPEAANAKFKLPAEWRPDADCRACAQDRGLDPDATADVFVDHFTNRRGKSETRSADGWRKRWQIWCRTDADRSGPVGARPARAAQPLAGNDAYFDQLAVIRDRARLRPVTVDAGRELDADAWTPVSDETGDEPI